MYLRPRKLANGIPQKATSISNRFYQQMQNQFQQRTSIDSSLLTRQGRLLESQLIFLLDASACVDQIRQLHACILCNGLDQCSYIVTKIIRTLARHSIAMRGYPWCMFSQVRNPNPFLFTALIRGYLNEGSVSEGVKMYGLMRSRGLRPISFTFSALFKACVAVDDANLGRQVHGQTIVIGGFDSDEHVANSMIQMYAKCGSLEDARNVFDEMPGPDVISYMELIVACSRCGDMVTARKLFRLLPEKDTVAWTAMITGLAQNANPGEAIRFFERMLDAGLKPDGATLAGVISACAQLGAARYGDWVREIAEKSGFGVGRSVIVGSALIDMYSKCGNIENAYGVFMKMKERNVFSYSSMILGFASHGKGRAAMELFKEMIKTETKPNEVTFIGVLTACSHGRMLEEGWRLFDSMRNHYNIEPSASHYTCMVDLLGRIGRLEEALNLIDMMPMKPNAGPWGALLGASHIHKNPTIARIAATHLFELEPDSIGNYILLAHTYASAGRWSDVAGVRKTMKAKGLKKTPGYSWIEAEKGAVHEFVAGDTTHPLINQIMKKVADLAESLADDGGYEPNLFSAPYDVDDDTKREILLTHSEKLALAFGLLSTDAGCTLRIMKNVRICEDCHSFICGVSRVTGRDIVVRDSWRFHHFRHGTCSCDDKERFLKEEAERGRKKLAEVKIAINSFTRGSSMKTWSTRLSFIPFSISSLWEAAPES